MVDAGRSKKVFFISECLVNQNIRAYGVRSMKGEGAVREILDLLMHYGYGITVVPCPEIPYEGLQRTACGKARYDNSAYRELCRKQADNVIERYTMYLADNYTVSGFICVNGSPSCAADYCYGGKTGETRCSEPGIFIEELQKKLAEKKMVLPFIGVKIKELDQALSTITHAIEKKQ